MRKLIVLTVSVVLFVFLVTGCESSVMSYEAEEVQTEQVEMASLAKAGGAYNDYGYNYNAHLFKGSYYNVYAKSAGFAPYRGDDVSYLEENPGAENHWAWPYRDIDLLMKWNDAWLSKTRERPSNYIGSGAWETNHMSGVDENGHWTYFIKIAAAPADAVKIDGIWYTPDGKEIGPVIWGAFAIIQEVESGVGATYISPAGPGFGKW